MRKLLLLLLVPVLSVAQRPSKKDYLITLKTDFGQMHLILFDQTPKHKENFIKLVDKNFYDGLLFHRIIENFMIQGGDPNSKNAQPGQFLGEGGVGYTIPAEFAPNLYHKKGALAAARDNNPQKASSGCQFYIVQGRIWDEENLKKQMERSGRTFTPEQVSTYRTLGGSPHLDGNYTVFGEVINGLAVVDSIAKQPRDSNNRPNQDLRMEMDGKWMKKKKITKLYGYKY